MSGNLDLTRLRDLVESKEIDTVLVCFPDMQGRLIGKRNTGHFFLDHVVDGMHVCDFLLTVDIDMTPVPGYAAASWGLGYGNLTVRPDLNTLRQIPWLPGTALVMGDCIDHEGNELRHSPRAILKRQIERATGAGYSVNMASELEFYLFDETYKSAGEKDYGDLKTSGTYIEDYHILQTSKDEPFLRAIRNNIEAAGIPVEGSKGEWGPGQQEVNLSYTEALEMADRHTIYKNGAKEIAHLHNKAITFMAKWNSDLAGNSCHVHSSLWDAESGASLFYDEASEHGMSKVFRHYLAGQLELAREMTYFFAPYINSYKRFQAGSFAPTNAVWGMDNRTVGLRVLGPGTSTRVECRIPGADANPYLAFAATLAAGLHGIEEELELEPIFAGDAYAADGIREVPKTLREGLEALDGSEVLRKALGDDVIDHYLRAGRWEQSESDRRISDWEVRRGFEQA